MADGDGIVANKTRLSTDAPQTLGAAPLFLISFRHRDELGELVEKAGWYPVAARRSDAAERRFLASGASIAVVDARGAFDDGMRAVQALAEAVESNAASLLVLISQGDVARLDAVHSAGATHYLASPFSAVELLATLRFVARNSERLGGGRRAAQMRSALLAAEEQSWNWVPGDHQVSVSAALSSRLDLPAGVTRLSARTLLKRLDREGRHAALKAIRRIRASGAATAFAHGSDTDADARIAQHLTSDLTGGGITGRIEDLDLVQKRRADSRDSLTGLTDARGLRRWIGRALEQSGDCTLILLSVSRFDMVNAAFGHGTGDVMLRAVARRIERLLIGLPDRKHILARLAGAEYAVALSGAMPSEEQRFLAEQMASEIARPFASGDTLVRLSCHVGLSASEHGEGDAGPLLRRASAALAEAKAGDGSGNIRSLDATGEQESAQQSMLEIDLRRALDQDEIDILFQPQFSIAGNKLVGVEALARWQHPQLGELGAVPLFTAAERSDYMVPLSAHVQRKALQIVAANRDLLRDVRVAINVTASDIAQPNFLGSFLAMIEESGVDPRQVTVEITESGLIEDLSHAALLLADMRSAGLRVAIDDFGTGYSSLAYLKALPLDYLKIDRRLAQDIAGSTRDRVVVKGVIEMARSLGLTVIAEGIETEQQLVLLAEAGVNIGQGFLMSEPISIADLARLHPIG